MKKMKIRDVEDEDKGQMMKKEEKGMKMNGIVFFIFYSLELFFIIF